MQYESKVTYWVALERASTLDGMNEEKNPESGLSMSSFEPCFVLATRITSKMKKATWNAQTVNPNMKKVGFSTGPWSAINV